MNLFQTGSSNLIFLVNLLWTGQILCSLNSNKAHNLFPRWIQTIFVGGFKSFVGGFTYLLIYDSLQLDSFFHHQGAAVPDIRICCYKTVWVTTHILSQSWRAEAFNKHFKNILVLHFTVTGVLLLSTELKDCLLI